MSLLSISKPRGFFKIITIFLVSLFLITSNTGRAQTGGALHFTNGDYIQLNAAFNTLAFSVTDFTVETWFKTSMSEGTLLSKRSICNVSNFWNLRISAGKIRWEMMEAGGVNTVDFSTALSYNDNLWHHVAVTRNGPVIRIFIDGYVVNALSTTVATNLNNVTDPIRIGQSACNNFIGEMDETRIWTEGRTICEIYTTKNYEYQGTENTLKFNAHYNQGIAGGSNPSVTSLTNSASNAFTGTLNSFALSGSSSNWISSTCPAQDITTDQPEIINVIGCGTSYNWQGATIVNSGTYTQTFTSVQGCDSVVTMNLLLHGLPVPSIVSSDDSACNGVGSVALTAVNNHVPTACTPTVPNYVSSTDDVITNFNFDNGQISNYTLSFSQTNRYTFYNNLKANVIAGQSYSFSSTVPLSYIVTQVGSITSVPGRAMWIDYNQDGDFSDAGEYVWSYTSNGLLTITGNITIPANASNGQTRMRIACKRGSIPSAQQYCGGYADAEFEDYVLNISGGVGSNSATWAPAAFLASTTGLTVNTTSITSAKTYTVTLTDAFGCSATATKTIHIHTPPSLSPTASPSPACLNSSISLNVNDGGKSKRTSPVGPYWEHNSNGYPPTNNISVSGIPSYGYKVNKIYLEVGVVSGTATNGAGDLRMWLTSPSGQNIVLMNEAGNSTGNFVATLVFQDNQPALPQSGVIVNGTYKPTNYGSFTPSNMVTSLSALTGNLNGTWVLNLFDVNGGSQTWATENFKIEFSGASWTANSTPAFNNIVNNFSPTTLATISGNTTYTASITDTNGCQNTASVSVTSLALPTSININNINDTICMGDAVTFMASGAATYNWMPGNLTGTTISIFPQQTTTYTVVGSNANGCSKTTTKTIFVKQPYDLAVTATPQTPCIGSITSLHVTSNNRFSTTSAGVYSNFGTTTSNINTMPLVAGAKVKRVYIYNLNVGSIFSGNLHLMLEAPNGQIVTLMRNAGVNTATNDVDLVFEMNQPFLPINFNQPIVSGTYAPTAFSTPYSLNLNSFTGTMNGNWILRYEMQNGTFLAGNGVDSFKVEFELPTLASANWFANSIPAQNGIVNTAAITTNAMVPSNTSYTVNATSNEGCISQGTLNVSVLPLPSFQITSSMPLPLCLIYPSTDLSVPSNLGLTNITWSPSTFLNSTSGNLVQVNNLLSNTTYTVQATGSNGCTNTATKSIMLDPCGNASQTNLKLFIQGYYTGNNTMNTVLANQGRPTLGGITDTVVVELRNPNSPYTVATTTKAILYTNGTTTAYFNPVQNGYYYIVIKYRNTIETWTPTPVLITNLSTYDFSTAANKALGNNQVAVGNGQFALYSGDVNQDGIIDAFDYIILDPDVISGVSGYLSTDLTGDGNVDAFDYIIQDANLVSGVGAVTP